MFGLGKPRTKFGKWIDNKGISQRDLEDMCKTNRNTVSRLCNDNDYEPYEDTLLRIISGLRKHGYNVSISDFW
jgi:transcriptional regulator with XRE-family HTH domain